MNIIIFGGFLGSGKTSIILSLARFIVEKEKLLGKTKLVIIENEIGETGIDDKVLRSNGYNVKELFSGCICCTLSCDLTIMLNDIAENVNPKWVIIECTGLAYPSKITDTLNKYGKGIESIRTVTVIDSERYEELSTIVPVLVKTQIAEGNTLIINKIDLITKDELKHIEKDVSQINSKAKVYKMSANISINNNIWEEVTQING